MVTLPPGLGGVARQAQMVDGLLRAHGYDVTSAWRAHYSTAPHLSAPSWRFWQAARCEQATGVTGDNAWAVGTPLPEFEWAHHLAWRNWRRLIDAHERIVVVSGNNLPAWVPYAMGRRSLNWIASPYWGDRQARVEAWPRWRRLYDAALNAWVTRRQERILLQRTDTWAIGDYALKELRALAPSSRSVHGIIIIPVDTAVFRPQDNLDTAADSAPFRIGITGRVSDPRKNMKLLVDAFARFARRHERAELHVRGDLSRQEFIDAYQAGGIADRLHVGPPLPRQELAGFLRSLHCFALMSHQEGLSQIAMEAMACGACVVSTRCGGPEEFVVDDETGVLTSFDPAEVADAFALLAGDSDRRLRLARAGAVRIAADYSPSRFAGQFMAAMETVFP